ncbi:MAG: NB-ARC domain-containing protein, partial [Pseudanabaena sp.]
MTTDPKNQQSALQGVEVGRDLTIENITQTINYYDRPNEQQSERVTHEQDFYHNLGDREIDRKSIFVGREADLDKLHKLLQAQSEQVGHLPTVLIVGMAGMGKSELARQYGKLHLNDFAGGVGIVMNAAQFGEEIRDFMRPRFCEDRDLRHGRTLKAQVTEGWQAWQKFCGTERSALIVIDDVTNYQEQVAPYLPSLSKSSGDRCPFRFVLTSRSRLRGDWAVHEIGELTTAAAVQVLTKWAEPNQQTVIDHPELAKSLCDRLGGLPLALTLVGSWLGVEGRTLPKVIADLNQNL